ncbi:MAG: serine acetyltransferase [Pseudomonadota bacterium]
MLISAKEADWTREAVARFWTLSRQLLNSIRRYQSAGSLGRKRAVLSHRFWSVVTGADIPINTQIGGGLILPHPNGIVIHPQSQIGPNCIVFQQVTLGVNRGQKGAPVIGGHVDIGPGARILGPVRIGDHAVIGANAVVLSDVPEGATAVGVPARILPQRG